MRLVLNSVFLLLTGFLMAQNTHELEMELESIAEGSEEGETDFTQIAENLQKLRQSPIAVNFADVEDLKQLPFLNVFQIGNLLQYRNRVGKLYGAFQLIAVKGFDKELIQRIEPYLSFRTEQAVPELNFKEMLQYSRHDFIARVNRGFPLRRGFTMDSAGYLGNPEDYYLRYRGNFSEHVSIGFLAQHDDGEPFATEYRDLPVDHISGFLMLEDYGKLSKAIVGDYQVELGQGLAVWSGFAFGKSANAMGVKRFPQKFRPFSGTEENRFFRGAAAVYELTDNWELAAFYSSHNIDANVSALDSTGAPFYVSSLQSSGLHRTERELADRKSNNLRAFGGNVEFQYKGLQLGLNMADYQLKLPLEQASELYRKFYFSGDQLSNYSLDFNYLYRDLNFFGEVAYSDNGAWAQLYGLQANPADGLYLSLLYRHFDKRYQALFSAPFSETGRNGESGAYLGMEWDISPLLKLQAYLDMYQFSWPRFRVDQPSQGRELFGQLNFDFTRRFGAYVRWQNDFRETNAGASGEQKIPSLVNRERNTVRLHLAYKLSKNWELDSRSQWAFQNQDGQKEQGNVIFQDIRYKPDSLPLQFTARYALIQTDSYDTRIYAYENDVLYSFSIPPYYGEATRFYLVVDWDLSEELSLQMKYGHTTFYDRDKISSGLNEIDGPRQSELTAQLRWDF